MHRREQAWKRAHESVDATLKDGGGGSENACVKQSERSLDAAQTHLIALLQEAADDQGQWHLPLNETEVGRMRTFMKEKLMAPPEESAEGQEQCDMESLLATSYAWMKKVSEDEGNKEAQQVVPLLQKVLQLYASEYLLTFSSQAEVALLQVRRIPSRTERGRERECRANYRPLPALRTCERFAKRGPNARPRQSLCRQPSFLEKFT